MKNYQTIMVPKEQSATTIFPIYLGGRPIDVFISRIESDMRVGGEIRIIYSITGFPKAPSVNKLLKSVGAKVIKNKKIAVRKYPASKEQS